MFGSVGSAGDDETYLSGCKMDALISKALFQNLKLLYVSSGCLSCSIFTGDEIVISLSNGRRAVHHV